MFPEELVERYTIEYIAADARRFPRNEFRARDARRTLALAKRQLRKDLSKKSSNINLQVEAAAVWMKKYSGCSLETAHWIVWCVCLQQHHNPVES